MRYIAPLLYSIHIREKIMHHRLFVCLIIMLSLLMTYDGYSMTSTKMEIHLSSAPQSPLALDDNNLQFVSMESIGRTEDMPNLPEANITPPISDSDRIYFDSAVISPDGERIIFQRDSGTTSTYICVYQFIANASTCTNMGERTFEFYGGYWSPNGRYFVLNLDVIGLTQARDIDILIYDTQDNLFINRTDDGVGYNDRFLNNDEMRSKVWMDIASTWSPNGDLYFFRNAIDPSVNEWRADLMRIPADDIIGTNSPEVIFRHPSNRPYTVFRAEIDKLNGVMNISPDGRYLAFSSMSEPGDPTNGIWIFDLIENAVKIHLDDDRLLVIMTGVPEWWIQTVSETGLFGLAPRSLAWTGDSNQLVILLFNNQLRPDLLLPLLRYDVAADMLDSFYDYSAISEDDLRQVPLFDDIPLLTDNIPSWALVSLTQQAIFYMGLNLANRQFILSMVNIVEDGFTTPRRITSIESISIFSKSFFSIGYNGDVVRILAGTNLITLREA